jgi:hypothetical protein
VLSPPPIVAVVLVAVVSVVNLLLLIFLLLFLTAARGAVADDNAGIASAEVSDSLAVAFSSSSSSSSAASLFLGVLSGLIDVSISAVIFVLQCQSHMRVERCTVGLHSLKNSPSDLLSLPFKPNFLIKRRLKHKRR